jgi:polyadenylate-binding protein
MNMQNMQFPPMMPGSFMPGPRPQPVPMQNLAPALYVGDLDENIREEALYDLFSKFGQIYFIRLMRDPGTGRSRGFAYVNFCNPRDAENAKHVAQYEKLGRKHIRIMYKRPNIKQLNTSSNIFIKNIDKAATIKDLHAELSKFGPILSAKLAVDSKGDSLGYGYVQFEREEDAKSTLVALSTHPYKFKETIIEGLEFKGRPERAPKKKNNLYIKHLPDKDEAVLTKEVEDAFSKYGTLEQWAVKKDAKINKYYSFVCFKEEGAAEKAMEYFNKDPAPPNPFGDSVPAYVSYAQTRQERDDELRQKKSQSNNQNNLFLKNLRPETTKELLKDLFAAFGEVVSCDSKEWNSPLNTKKLRYGFVAFKSAEEASQAKIAAEDNLEIKKLFTDDKPYINIFQPREMRSKFLQTQFRTRHQSAPHFGGGYQTNLEMQSNLMNPNRKVPSMFPPYAFGPMQGAVGMPQQMRMGGYQPMNRKPFVPRNNMQPMGGDNRGGPRPRMPNQGQWGGNRPPMGAGGDRGMPRPYGGPQGNRQFQPYGGGERQGERRPYGNRDNMGGQMPQTDQARPADSKPLKPTASSALAPNLTIADLKNKWQEFIKLDKEKQRNILGELLFPLIKERIGEDIAPKITGMLIDLDVLEIQDIFEFLEDKDLLDERIKEARELIVNEGA